MRRPFFRFCFCSFQKTTKFHNAWVGGNYFFFVFAIPFISEFRTGVFTFRSWIKHFRRQRCFSFPVLQVNISLPFAMLKVSNSGFFIFTCGPGNEDRSGSLTSKCEDEAPVRNSLPGIIFALPPINSRKPIRSQPGSRACLILHNAIQSISCPHTGGFIFSTKTALWYIYYGYDCSYFTWYNYLYVRRTYYNILHTAHVSGILCRMQYVSSWRFLLNTSGTLHHEGAKQTVS